MKKMEPAEVYVFGKMLISDRQQAKVFTLVYEIHNGLLIAEALEGDATAAESPAHVLAGVFACMMDQQASGFLVKAFEIVEDPEALIMDMAERIEALPIAILADDKDEMEVTHPPEVAAAFVAAQDPTGKRSYLLYRHPDVDRDRAILLVKAALRFAADRAAENEKRERQEN